MMHTINHILGGTTCKRKLKWTIHWRFYLFQIWITTKQLCWMEWFSFYFSCCFAAISATIHEFTNNTTIGFLVFIKPSNREISNMQTHTRTSHAQKRTIQSKKKKKRNGLVISIWFVVSPMRYIIEVIPNNCTFYSLIILLSMNYYCACMFSFLSPPQIHNNTFFFYWKKSILFLRMNNFKCLWFEWIEMQKERKREQVVC